MNKKIILLASLMLLVGITGFVFAIEGNTWVTETEANFFEGWNLVYGFIHPNQLEGQFLEASHIKAVYAFNPKTQEYARVYPNPEENKLSSITEDELSQTALFVYSDISTQTEYWLDNALQSLDQRQMYAGWNFVGVTSDMLGSGGKPELKDLAGTCNIQKAYFFNPEQQNWNTFPLDEDFSSDALNMGILIKVTNDCKMGNSGSLVTPPSIPN